MMQVGTIKRRKFLPALLLLIGVTAGCRLDMHIQPYYRPLAQSDFFGDNRSARLPVEGTVARGDLHEDTYFYTGKINNAPGEYMPFPATAEVLAAGASASISIARRAMDASAMATALSPRADSTVLPSLSHRAFAQGAHWLLFRCHDQRLRRDARIWNASRAA